MKIVDFLEKNAICLNLKAQDKMAVVEELVNILIDSECINAEQRGQLIESVLKRETLGSTGIGQGIAIPHGRLPGKNKIVASFGISKQGVDFEALDGQSVYIFFLLGSPTDLVGPHLKALARISKLLKDKHFRMLLCKAKTRDEIWKIISEEDEKRP